MEQSITVSCHLLRSDGGPVEGAAARCSNSDGGATTDSTGLFSFEATEITCGIATGSVDCGSVRFTEDGGVFEVSRPGENNYRFEVHATQLKSSDCSLVTR